MFARIALAVPFGAAVTSALLFLMHLMTVTGQGVAGPQSQHLVEFVRVERKEVVATRDQRPDRPEALERAPAMPPPAGSEEFSGAVRVAMTRPRIGFGAGSLGGIDFGGSDGEYLPIVKVAPRYPLRAAQRRLEGYVVVQFVVTASGAVRDVIVVESSSELFEAAAVEAALKFKYKPRIVDGQPIEVAGVQNRITFKLDA